MEKKLGHLDACDWFLSTCVFVINHNPLGKEKVKDLGVYTMFIEVFNVLLYTIERLTFPIRTELL